MIANPTFIMILAITYLPITFLLEFRFAVGYGDFVQLIMLTKDGHLSLGISRKARAGELAARVKSVLQEHGQAWTPAAPWLLA